MKKILNMLLLLMMAVTVVLSAWAISSTDEATGQLAGINASLTWGYVLIGLAVLAALFCALYGMIKNPDGLIGSLVSLGLFIVVAGAAYFIASGHNISFPDISNPGEYFSRNETIITETSMLVAYVIMGATIVVAVGSEIYKSLK